MHKNSISFRLMLYFVCLMLFPILLLSTFMQVTYRNSIIEIATNSAVNDLTAISDNIDQQFATYTNLAYFISRDHQLQQVSTMVSASTYNRYISQRNNINTLLGGYTSSGGNVRRVRISYENGISIGSDDVYAIDYDPQVQDWYQLCQSQPEQVHVMTYSAMEPIYDQLAPVNAGLITVCRSLHDRDGSFIGAVSVEVYQFVLDESMANMLNRDGSYVYVRDSEGTMVYSPVIYESDDPVNTSSQQVVSVFNQQNQWEIIAILNMSAYLEQVDFVTHTLYIALAAIAIITGVFSMAMSRSIVRPIKTLQLLMKQAERGDLSVRFQSEKAPREIVALGDSFNVMTQRLDLQIKQTVAEQKAKQKAEMVALQANIKPHFLYNTLDTIHWMAKSYHAHDIVKTVGALSTLFRISLSKGSNTISVAQEIRHVTSYLEIQKVRYEEMVEFSVHVTEDCKQLQVEKLILQPLVENAIYHGIKESGRVGTITVNVWRHDDDLFLSVVDNGSGMTPARQEQVHHSLAEFITEENGSYGVVNVHQRLRLTYGAPYGLSLSSQENVGTIALLRLPAGGGQ